MQAKFRAGLIGGVLKQTGRYDNIHLRGKAVFANELKLMASSKEYLDFILEQFDQRSDVSYRGMMGEYILYYRGKVVGGIYDDRFLVKPTRSAMAMMPHATRELPYDGAKEMLLVDRVEDRDFLRKLLEAMSKELPEPKKKK